MKLSSRRQILLLHSTALFFIASFLLTGNHWQFRIDGDDIVHTYGEDISVRLHGPRYLLNIGYYFIKNNLFGSFETSMKFMWIVHIGSGILLYRVLRLLLAPISALFGALLFIGYSSKHEILTWYGASLYIVVGLLIILTIWILLKPWGPIKRGALIGLIGAISMLFYEVFVTLGPAYLLFMVATDVSKKRRISLTTLVGGFLPVLAVLLHLTFLVTTGSQNWGRSSHQPEVSRLSVFEKAGYGFRNTLSETVGDRHIDLVRHTNWVFRNHIAPDSPALLFLLAGLLGVSLVAIFLKSTPHPPPDRARSNSRLIFAGLGFYLFLFAGIPSFVNGIAYTPPRLTLLPALGLCLILAVLGDLMQRIRIPNKYIRLAPQRIYFMGIMLVCLAESVSLKAIAYQNQESGALDTAIASQIKNIYPVAQDDDLFIGFVEPSPIAKKRYWDQAPSVFESGGAHGRLWHTYRMNINSIDYKRVRFFPDRETHQEIGELMEEWIDSEPPQTILPFQIGGEGQVHGVREIRLFDKASGENWKWSFPRMQQNESAPTIEFEFERDEDGQYRLRSQA